MPHSPRTRHDGWTADRQAMFIAALRISRSVSRAAAAAGMSRNSAYQLRRRPSAAAFASAWDHALRQGDKGYTSLAHAIRDGRLKVTPPPSSKVTKATPPAISAPMVNASQLVGARLAPRHKLP